jgi:hypothetical protein
MTTRLVVVIRENLDSQMPNLPGTVPRASRDRFAFTTTEGGGCAGTTSTSAISGPR